MRRRSCKLFVICLLTTGFLIALPFGPLQVHATTVAQVISQVDQEYAASEIDADTHQKMMAALQQAESAAVGSDDYRAAVEEFRFIISTSTGTNITSDAAARLFSLAAGL